jgi:uncharacterized membrane protein HdeD (DUF308 family)
MPGERTYYAWNYFEKGDLPMNGFSPQKYWWAVTIRGLCAILFGLAALFWTGLTIHLLVLWFGAYALVTGFFALITAFQAMAHHQRWWLLLFEGFTGIAAGLFTFFWPGNTALILVLLIAIWAVFSGIFEISAALTAPWPTATKWLLGISGAFSVLLGILIYRSPVAGAFSITWVLGAYALIFGISIFTLGLRLRNPSPLRSAP